MSSIDNSVTSTVRRYGDSAPPSAAADAAMIITTTAKRTDGRCLNRNFSTTFEDIGDANNDATALTEEVTR